MILSVFYHTPHEISFFERFGYNSQSRLVYELDEQAEKITTIRKDIDMNRYQELEALLESLKEDFQKFYEGSNKAAGTRVRKGMLELREKAQEIRKEVQEIKNQ